MFCPSIDKYVSQSSNRLESKNGDFAEHARYFTNFIAALVILWCGFIIIFGVGEHCSCAGFESWLRAFTLIQRRQCY